MAIAIRLLGSGTGVKLRNRVPPAANIENVPPSSELANPLVSTSNLFGPNPLIVSYVAIWNEYAAVGPSSLPSPPNYNSSSPSVASSCIPAFNSAKT